MIHRVLLVAFATLALAGCDLDESPMPPSPIGRQASAGQVDPAPAPASGGGQSSAPQAAPVPVQATGDGPTEAEVKRAVTGMFMSVYKESYMKEEEITIAFSNMKFAPRTQKNLFGGYYDQPIDVWPVRADVTITWTRGEDVRTWKRGTQNKESFSFFKDEFGGWDFRTSGL